MFLRLNYTCVLDLERNHITKGKEKLKPKQSNMGGRAVRPKVWGRRCFHSCMSTVIRKPVGFGVGFLGCFFLFYCYKLYLLSSIATSEILWRQVKRELKELCHAVCDKHSH